MNDKGKDSDLISYGNAPANSSGGCMGELQPHSSAPTRIKEAFQQWYANRQINWEFNPHACETAYEAGYLAKEKELAEQKPVAEVHTWDKFGVSVFSLVRDGRVIVEGTKLYAAPVDQSARIAELEAEINGYSENRVEFE